MFNKKQVHEREDLKATLFKKIGSDYIEGGLNSFLNPYSYYLMRNEGEINRKIDRYMIDGWLLILLMKFFYHRKMKRLSFDLTSLAPVIFQRAVLQKKKIYLLGTTKEKIALAVKEIQKAYPGMEIVGYRDGYFQDKEKEEIIKEILSVAPDYFICGMGSIKQESFLISLREHGWTGTGFTCGGFFHQTAKGINYYPNWANKFFLRWLYRIYDEPKLVKRYSFEYGRAICYFFYDIF